MATDLEELELVAKLVGLKVWRGSWPQDDMIFAAPLNPSPSSVITGVEWNPRDDDGDALRLAVKLGMAVSVEYQSGSTSVLWGPPMGAVREWHGTDPFIATRRAIVRAAAEMGKRMREKEG